MDVQLRLNYEQLFALVEQLPSDQQARLIRELLERHGQTRRLSIEEKLQLLDAMTIHDPVNQTPSLRREDWYGDDGR